MEFSLYKNKIFFVRIQAEPAQRIKNLRLNPLTVSGEEACLFYICKAKYLLGKTFQADGKASVGRGAVLEH
jgi:hypothetical protein